MRTLVTGGTGFIGSNLVLRLVRDGHEVLATGTPGEQDLRALPVQWFPKDFAALLWENIGKVDVVFHLAANNDTTLLDRARMFHENLAASQQLFAAAVAHGCRRIVYASSCSVYGDLPPPFREDGPFRPLNPYAESKLALDEWAMAFAREHPEVTVMGLRYSNVYGPRENHKGRRATMIYQLAQQMTQENPRLFKHGEQKRDYIYVDDTVEANLLAARSPQSGIVNCGSGSATSFNELVAILNEVLGMARTPVYVDNPYAARYQSHTECDMTRARALIRFVPRVDIRAGVRRYAASGYLVGPRAVLRAEAPSDTVGTATA